MRVALHHQFSHDPMWLRCSNMAILLDCSEPVDCACVHGRQWTLNLDAAVNRNDALSPLHVARKDGATENRNIVFQRLSYIEARICILFTQSPIVLTRFPGVYRISAHFPDSEVFSGFALRPLC
jgi:hypothetical protein